MHILISGALYFVLTYSAGFAFGMLRELLVAPRLGPFAATVIETPLMLAVTYLAASYVVGRYDVPPSTADRLAIGGLAFAFLMLAEIAFSSFLRGWSFQQWVENLKTADGAISLTMFVIFAFMPTVIKRG